MVLRVKLVFRDLKENEVGLLHVFENQRMNIFLGGTAPGFWGERGVPGTPGRSGGEHLQ